MPSEGATAAESAVVAAGQAARGAAGALRDATAECLNGALLAIAARLGERAADVIAANGEDVRAAKADGLPDAFVDRLTLDAGRVEAMMDQLRALARVAAEPARTWVRDLPDGLELQEWRRPVGVIGANFEARPNVVVDIASQLIKSRNAGVLRTGSSAIRSAAVLVDEVLGPAMAAAGLDGSAIQLLRVPGHQSALALVRQTRLIPLVILRGSGESTRELAREAALHGVRTLAHADGGAVIYVDSVRRHRPGAAADRAQPGPARRLQPAEPAARRSGRVWDADGPAGDRAGGPDRHRGLAAAAPAPARPRVGAGRRVGGHDHGGASRRRGGRGRDRQPGDLRARRLDRRRGRGGGRAVPGRLFRYGRVLECDARGCSTGSSCCRCRRPGSTSTSCPGRAGR